MTTARLTELHSDYCVVDDNSIGETERTVVFLPREAELLSEMTMIKRISVPKVLAILRAHIGELT